MSPMARLHGSRGDEFPVVSVVKGWQVRQGFIFVTVKGELDDSNLSVSCAIRAGEGRAAVESVLRVLTRQARGRTQDSRLIGAVVMRISASLPNSLEVTLAFSIGTSPLVIIPQFWAH